MLKDKNLTWVVGILVIVLISALKYHAVLWPYISVISIILSCYHFQDEKLEINIAVILFCFVFATIGLFTDPGIASAIILQAGWLLYSIFTFEKKTISSLFIPLLLQAFLIVEYTLNSSVHLMELDVVLSIYTVLNLINYFACSKRTPIPIACAVLYCLGASFFYIQVLLSIVLIYELLNGKSHSSKRTAISLSIWTSLQTLWPIMTVILLVIPSSKLIGDEKLKQLVVPLALSGGLILDTPLAVKILILIALLISLRSYRQEKRAISQC